MPLKRRQRDDDGVTTTTTAAAALPRQRRRRHSGTTRATETKTTTTRALCHHHRCLHAFTSCRSLGASAAACTLYTMRREHDTAKSELHRTQLEFARLEERYKLLEKTLKDTRELLRAREVEVDTLRKDRDKLIVDRFSKERSPSASLHRRRSSQHQQNLI
ncbi:hypothetical protein EV363DRAFT_1448714 [Boletus edulis]|nr:hypothetical protein EV363DRAFT_1448714 [Boletus edulis]